VGYKKLIELDVFRTGWGSLQNEYAFFLFCSIMEKFTKSCRSRMVWLGFILRPRTAKEMSKKLKLK